MMQHLTQEMEQDETRNYRHLVGSPITNSPPGTWAQYGSPSENSPLQGFSRSPTAVVNGHLGGNHLFGLAPVHPPLISPAMKIAAIGKDQRRINNADLYSNSNSSQGVAIQQPCSLSDNSSGMMPNVNSGSIGTLNGPQFLWGSPAPYSDNSQTSAWQSPSMSHSLMTSGPGMGQGHGVPYPSRHVPFIASSQNHHYHHHVGSAPSRIRNFGYFPESPDASLKNPAAFGGTGTSRNEGSSAMNYSRSPINPSALLSGNISENGLANFRMLPSQRIGPSKFYGNATYSGLGSIGYEGLTECNHSRRVDNMVSQLDSKKQYQLDLEKIVSGEDTRTTLMIKNIPNKYTSKMLLAAIDETHEGAYDFLYLPIDFKNKCNVGYAFINMVSSSHIISFYEAFNGKKWEKFNSEKVASLAYARIQGKEALVTHFQNSSLMNEDKRCRPIMFHPQGSEAGDQELFPSNGIDGRIGDQNEDLQNSNLTASGTVKI